MPPLHSRAQGCGIRPGVHLRYLDQLLWTEVDARSPPEAPSKARRSTSANSVCGCCNRPDCPPRSSQPAGTP